VSQKNGVIIMILGSSYGISNNTSYTNYID